MSEGDHADTGTWRDGCSRIGKAIAKDPTTRPCGLVSCRTSSWPLGLVLHYKKAGQSMRAKAMLVVYIDAYERDERINRLGRFYSRCRRDYTDTATALGPFWSVKEREVRMYHCRSLLQFESLLLQSLIAA